MKYNKKLVIFILWLSLLAVMLEAKHSSADTTLNRHNLEMLYKQDSLLINKESVKPSTDVVTTHMLKYKVDDKDLSVFLLNEWTTEQFKNKEVDIYALSAPDICGCSTKRYNVYGGLTVANKENVQSKEEYHIPINLWIKRKQETKHLSVSTKKRIVTAQEIDIKVRKLLISQYDIYSNSDQKYSKGSVTLDVNSGKDITYDLYYFGNGEFDSMLKIYINNETVTVDQCHVDVVIN